MLFDTILNGETITLHLLNTQGDAVGQAGTLTFGITKRAEAFQTQGHSLGCEKMHDCCSIENAYQAPKNTHTERYDGWMGPSGHLKWALNMGCQPLQVLF